MGRILQSSATLRVFLLALIPLAVAHGQDEDMTMDRPTISTESDAAVADPVSYFQHGEHSSLMFAHILLMTTSWVFVLPIGVMFSIARSRYSLAVQFLFLALNAIGVLLVTIYNANTPDLYPNNAHHKLGWLLTWIVSAQITMGIISAYTGRHNATPHPEREGFMPVSTEAMEEHQRIHDLRMAETYRFSNDSGQGTEPNTESLRSQSISSTGDDELKIPGLSRRNTDDSMEEEKHGLLHGGRLDQFLSKKIPGLLSSRVLRFFQFLYDVVDRLILILGFVALTTGFVTYGGLFMGDRIFSGLAHFIKGGVFFWYGILTLGRWAGCFAEIGWAWNVKPFKTNRPSAEFVESFLIFFYGVTNVFLEHLAAWGSEWTAEDFEHISITIMFIGGGLCGMLIESGKIRDLLNVTIQEPSRSHDAYRSSERDALEPPKSYRFSMNPIPALIVLLLGLMMSSHHQETMFATMVHKQWGNLLVGAAFARAATYIIFYLSPPTSILPGRPPTELITAFALMAGGAIFMSSARDCILSMEALKLDAMFVFTVAMGIITFLMAWIVLVIAIKGWAVKRKNGSVGFQTMA